MRAKQRAVVQAFIANYEAAGGWAIQSVIGQYANDALRLHSESYMMHILQDRGDPGKTAEMRKKQPLSGLGVAKTAEMRK